MNTIDRVKALCKEQKIAVSKLEKQLGYGNGYFNSLKKGVLPNDRLYEVANYLKVDPEYLSSGEENKKTVIIDDGNEDYFNSDAIEYINMVFTQLDFERKLRLVNEARSLKQEQLDADSLTESD